jgi:hypothetical protein
MLLPLFDFYGHARVQLNDMVKSMNLRAQLHELSAFQEVLVAAETATLIEVKHALHLQGPQFVDTVQCMHTDMRCTQH